VLGGLSWPVGEKVQTSGVTDHCDIFLENSLTARLDDTVTNTSQVPTKPNYKNCSAKFR
jgi:hypothetical protein